MTLHLQVVGSLDWRAKGVCCNINTRKEGLASPSSQNLFYNLSEHTETSILTTGLEDQEVHVQPCGL